MSEIILGVVGLIALLWLMSSKPSKLVEHEARLSMIEPSFYPTMWDKSIKKAVLDDDKENTQ